TSTTLKELFTEVEAQIDYKFAYTNSLDTERRYFKEEVRLKRVSLEEFIAKLNENLPLRFSVLGDNITVHDALNNKQAYAIYSGRILDEQGEPLIGVSIHIKEANTGTSTDASGNFSIRLPSDNYTVSVTYIGYKSVEKSLLLSQDVNQEFELELDTQTLEEVVVTDQNMAVNIKKPQMSVNHHSMRQIKQIPVAMGEADPLKALMTLPGVTNAGDGS